MNAAPALIAALALASCLCGCGDDDCQVVCEKNAECQLDSPGEESCIELCEQLSEDDEYAEALAEHAECVAEEDCNAIASGACAPDLS